VTDRPALRYHGAKFRLAPWLLKFFPPHECFTEAFGGAAGVLLQKPRSYAEVYNDLDGDVVNFFRVLHDREPREQLVSACVLTPCAREEFDLAWEPTDEPVERARRIAIRAQMGFGSCGATKGQTGIRIENRPALEVLLEHDAPDTLHFVDPPYLHSTRVLGEHKAGYYRHEMSDHEHIELLDCLRGLGGMVIVTAYPCELYRDALADWVPYATDSRCSLGRGGGVRTEVAWLNRACAERQNQQRLFA
jgi:DNA adenine methylase